MLLNVAENLAVEAPNAEVWALLRDTPRLAGLLPGVESVTAIEGPEGEAYEARILEKVGPFKLTLRMEVTVVEAREPNFLKAAIKGTDPLGATRTSGEIRVGLEDAGAATHMTFEADVEVLGKLATLGSPVIKRRTKDLFSVFAKRIQGEFAKVAS